MVTPANYSERQAAQDMLAYIHHAKAYPRTIWKVLADKGYEGKDVALNCFQQYHVHLQAMQRKETRKADTQEGFEQRECFRQDLNFTISQHRWVVERSHAWQGKNRRMNINYEQKPKIHEAFVKLSNIVICVQRLVRGN